MRWDLEAPLPAHTSAYGGLEVGMQMRPSRAANQKLGQGDAVSTPLNPDCEHVCGVLGPLSHNIKPGGHPLVLFSFAFGWIRLMSAPPHPLHESCPSLLHTHPV